jgi:hypothetical protein
MLRVSERIQSRISAVKSELRTHGFGALIPAAKLLRALRSR